MEKYNSNIKLGTATLNVVNLERTKFKFLYRIKWEWS